MQNDNNHTDKVAEIMRFWTDFVPEQVKKLFADIYYGTVKADVRKLL